MNIRDIFAEELERVGEHALARRVRDNTDNSHGGEAAIRAIQRVIAAFDTGRSATRDAAYAALDGEIAYAEAKWDGHQHTVTEWVAYILDYVNEALKQVARNSEPMASALALDTVRKIGGMAVQCMEQNGVRERELPIPTTYHGHSTADREADARDGTENSDTAIGLRGPHGPGPCPTGIEESNRFDVC